MKKLRKLRKVTLFRELRAKHAFGSSFVKLSPYLQHSIANSEVELRKLFPKGKPKMYVP